MFILFKYVDRLLAPAGDRLKDWCRLFCICLVLLVPHPARAELNEASLAESLAVLRTIDGVGELDIHEARASLATMSYTENLVFQALCRLPGAKQTMVGGFLEVAGHSHLRFANITILDRFVTLPGTDFADCLKLLDLLDNTNFMQERALVALENAKVDNKADFFAIIEKILSLPDTGLWCTIGLFTQPELSGLLVLLALEQLTTMTVEQQQAAEKYLMRKDLDQTLIPQDLAAISRLTGSAVANFRAFCANEQKSQESVSQWLHTFFILPPQEQENEFLLMERSMRRQLLDSYHHAASTIIWRINSLHAVTDRFGREIGTASLTRMEPDNFAALFASLPEAARNPSAKAFYRALVENRRSGAIAELRTATVAARRLAAVELTSANLYVLLANGGELYTSSFREIVAPTLQNRITRDFHGQLLRFLRTIDLDTRYIADFITNLAQKGVLPSFLPGNGDEQWEIVDLVADSALADENSLVLFSATFANLLQTFVPKVRDRLVDRLLRAAGNENQLFSRQVRVILQFYYHSFPELLSVVALQRIKELLAARGEIDLQGYTTTPFVEWREDGRLASLSTFAGDDDGWTSYTSFCQYLLESGYLPVLSLRYRFGGDKADVAGEFSQLTAAVKRTPSSALSSLFALSTKHPAVIEWQKTINRMAVVHAVYVYTGAENQQRLLEVFLREGDEMFAQRGHSYYRNTQLLEPLTTLLAEGKVNEELLGAKPRFISLGSCGGIKAYTLINELFGNHVDIFGTVGTGTALINNPFNRRLLEIAALPAPPVSWLEVERLLGGVYGGNKGNSDYLAPGSLPAILHKVHQRSGAPVVLEDDNEP